MKYVPRVLRYLRPYKLLAVASVVVTVLSSLVGLLVPWPLKVLIDNVLSDHDLGGIPGTLLGPLSNDATSLLIVVVIASIFIHLTSNLLAVAGEYVNTKLELSVVLDFRSDLFRHAQKLSVAFADQISTGRLMYGVNFEAAAAGAVVISLQPLLQSLITLIGMLVIAFTIDPLLAVLSLTVIPVLSYSVRYYAMKIQPELHKVKGMEMESLSIVHEAMQLLPVVVAFGREEHEHRRYQQLGKRTVDQRVDLTVRQTLFSLVVNMTTVAGTALVLGFGAYHALNGRLTAGELLIVLAYINAVYQPLEAISHTVGSLQDRFVGLQIAYHLFDTEPTVKEAPNARDIGRSSGHVTFDDVYFNYPSRVGTLKGISFDAQPGEVVAIVGPTGAGKSTMMSLMPRFYDANAGSILLDGHDTRELKLDCLRDQISIVLQEPLLFSGSIAENIRYGRLDASDEDIVTAAKAANCDDFIQRLPQGYDTQIGERGVQLSGGERQRICVARAFLKDAPILILDEPTSSIDSRTEGMILDALDELMVGRTTFIIAHRLSTVRHADKILVIDQGELVEKGSHEELLQLGGTYSELYDMQTSWSGRMRKIEPAVESLVTSLGGSDKEVQALLALEDTLSRSPDVTSATATVINWARSYLDAEAVALFGPSGADTRMLGSVPEQDLPSIELANHLALASSYEQGAPLEIELAREDPWLSQLGAGLHPMAAGLYLPLTSGDESVGLLALTLRETRPLVPAVMRLAGHTIGKALVSRAQPGTDADNAGSWRETDQELVGVGDSRASERGQE